MIHLTLLVTGLLLLLAELKTDPATAVAPVSTPTPAKEPDLRRQLDACSLVTDKEIEAVQGVSLTSKTPSQKSENGFAVSQCYFLLRSPESSIVLTVQSQKDSSHGRGVKEFWAEMFRHKIHNAAGKEEEEEDQDKAPVPQEISGLGDEAFWTAQRFGGILHVLEGDVYLKISIGGAGDLTAKLDKSKAIARIALKRL